MASLLSSCSLRMLQKRPRRRDLVCTVCLILFTVCGESAECARMRRLRKYILKERQPIPEATEADIEMTQAFAQEEDGPRKDEMQTVLQGDLKDNGMAQRSAQDEEVSQENGGNPSEKDKRMLELFQSMSTRLGSLLAMEGASSTLYAAEEGTCLNTNIQGLDAIKFFHHLLPSHGTFSEMLRNTFSSSPSIQMISALRPGRNTFQIKGDVGFPTVENESKQLFSMRVYLKLHEPEADDTDMEFISTLFEHELGLHHLFNVNSLDDVECRFRVKTIKDVLFVPEQKACLPHSDGCILNFFLLHNPATTTLHSIAETMERHAGSDTMSKQVKIARLSLSVQLVQIVAEARKRRVVLPAFVPVYLHVDEHGNLSVLALFPPHSETNLDLPKGWQRSDFHTNARSTAFALLFTWCPDETEKQFPVFSTVTPEELLLAASYPHCSPMPQGLRMLIAEILMSGGDVENVLESDPYFAVEALLDKECRENRTGAEGASI